MGISGGAEGTLQDPKGEENGSGNLQVTWKGAGVGVVRWLDVDTQAVQDVDGQAC